jgi:type IV pilus assembly protein PilB
MQSDLITKMKYKNLLKEEHLNKLHNLKNEKYIFEFITSNEIISFKTLSNFLKEEYSIESINILEQKISKKVINILSHEDILKHSTIPINIESNTMIVGITNPFDYINIENISIIAGMPIKQFFIDNQDFKKFTNNMYTGESIENIASNFKDEAQKSDLDSIKYSQDIINAPAVKVLEKILEYAIIVKASDIHIEPQQNTVRVRYRVDGKLIQAQNIDIKLFSNLISRLKIVSNMDISKKREPQEGKYEKEINKNKIELRVSLIPTVYGEKAVIRLVYSSLTGFDIKKLGFLESDFNKIDKLLKNQHGIVLVTGTTGSGKTTTLSAFINKINKEDINIVTIEDPVENIMHGINQISISQKNNFDFSDALKFILRQDPDVIMVGEIRDTDTAVISIRSAMTGHLVLSTLHTNDAVSSITRLVDMGVPSYLIASTLKGIISQRLVRSLCKFCKIKTTIKHEDATTLKLDTNTVVYEKLGCLKCNNIGYLGRFAVYEILTIDKELKNAIKEQLSEDEIFKIAKKIGMVPIFDNALQNVLEGNTSIKEMYAAAYKDF